MLNKPGADSKMDQKMTTLFQDVSLHFHIMVCLSIHAIHAINAIVRLSVSFFFKKNR